MRAVPWILCTLSACLCLPSPLVAQDAGPPPGPADPLVVPRTETAIRVDAILDESAWRDALSIDLAIEVLAGENVAASVQTEVLLVYDDGSLYAGFRCQDPNPAAIRAHMRDRDTLGGDDWVGLILDTFNDQRRSYDFIVSAAGVQLDLIEAQTGEDTGWDAIWESASRITEWGYVVEIAVPFSSLSFQRKDGPQIWGFDAVRRYPRDQTYHFATFPRDRSNNCYLCQALKISGFDTARPGRNVELDPTVIAFSTDERPLFPGGELRNSEQDAQVGLTARWGVTPNLTLNAAVNPDFSQVEADDRQLDINEPFALFFPERRPFFTEGADYFAALENIIYTRSIREPSWGFKVTGKERANTIGAYVMRDDITNLILPRSQGSNSTTLSMANTSSVIRYKRDLGSRYTVGLLSTLREADSYHNRVFGADLDFRVTPTNQIQLLVLGSSTAYPESVREEHSQPAGSVTDRLISFEYDHYTRSWGWWADYEEAGEHFRADLGYYPRVGYRNVEGGLLHTWNGDPGSWWSMFRAGADLAYFEDQDGQLLEKSASVWLRYRGTLQSQGELRAWRSRDAYAGAEYDQTAVMVHGSLWPTADLQIGAFAIVGDQIDYANARPGGRYRINPWATYALGPRIRLSVNHNFERMSVHDDRLYTANISQASAVYQFSNRTFIRAILQYVDYDYNTRNYTFERDAEERRILTQVLFSYKFNARTVLFLGYVDHHRGSQEYAITRSDRTFFVKLGYAWLL